jgi:hypothetical protein
VLRNRVVCVGRRKLFHIFLNAPVFVVKKFQLSFLLRELSGSHSGKYEDESLLGYGAV